MNKQHHLTITYGTSRGRDTYGYTVASLRENGSLKARCNGGGYDMRGTVFADWLEGAYQQRLVALAKRGKFTRIIWNGKPGDASEYKYPDTNKPRNKLLYGGNYYPKGNSKCPAPLVTLDGGCGFSSIQRIAEVIGLKLQTVDAGKNIDVLIVTDERGK